MNISKTWHPDISQLPRTSVDLARIIKAAQPKTGIAATNRALKSGYDDAVYSPAVTYASQGSGVILQKKLTGALLDIRA